MTHNERVLDLLSDGLPHSHHELYRLHVMGHSRVADLRKQGHDIACWREGDSYFYRLSLRTAPSRPEAQSLPGGAARSEDVFEQGEPVGDLAVTGHGPLHGEPHSGSQPEPVQFSPDPLQLTLDEAEAA